MGDFPTKRDRTSLEMVHDILQPALAHETLRDELFCQLLKQVTNNPSSVSEARGWELLLLASGLFYCSTALLPAITAYFKARSHLKFASLCDRRLFKTRTAGERKRLPHLLEVESAQNNGRPIQQQIYFPDGRYRLIEIDSGTMRHDIIKAIKKELELRSVEGFSLYVTLKSGAEVCMTEDGHVFDFVQNVLEHYKVEDAHAFSLLVKKRVALATVYGDDPVADAMFHYYQEVPNVVHGFYKVDADTALSLAELQYRVIYAGIQDGDPRLPDIRHAIKDLLPVDIFPLNTLDEWATKWNGVHKRHAGMGVGEAKQIFLEIVKQFPHSGSAFFAVTQKVAPGNKKKAIVAINSTGFYVLDWASKEVDLHCSLQAIAYWNSGEGRFHLTTGDLLQPRTFLCSSPEVDNISSLLTEYVEAVNRESVLDETSMYQLEGGEPPKTPKTPVPNNTE
eukprot:Colp12_sorted_trinity150504_noHs@19320